MKWNQASTTQLYCIAYDDPMATTIDQRQALEEILRRKKRKRKHYPSEYRIKAEYV